VGGPQARSGQVQKISPPPGVDPRTVQPVASRYTVYVTRPIFGIQDTSQIELLLSIKQKTTIYKELNRSISMADGKIPQFSWSYEPELNT